MSKKQMEQKGMTFDHMNFHQNRFINGFARKEKA